MTVLSIVVPVYNVEKYLRQCLDSVIGAKTDEYEIVCVNDGSTDSSPAILEEYRDEIISRADSVVVEIDMDADILKQVFALADKYGKKVYAVVSNMSIALERRDLMKHTGCVVCNDQEAGLLFSEDYRNTTPEQLAKRINEKVKQAKYPKMVVTMGDKGAVWAEMDDGCGVCPPQDTAVVDTTGAGDAFFAGVTLGLTYGKSLAKACEIGTRLASSVIATTENVCPRFLPSAFDLELVCAESINEDSQGTAS